MTSRLMSIWSERNGIQLGGGDDDGISGWVIGIIILIVFLCLSVSSGIGGYFYWKKQQESTVPASTTSSTAPASTTSSTAPASTTSSK